MSLLSLSSKNESTVSDLSNVIEDMRLCRLANVPLLAPKLGEVDSLAASDGLVGFLRML